MTVSTHVYTATLTGKPDRVLSVRGGRITLDAGSAPHVSGTLELVMPDAATLRALDPRTSPRVIVRADMLSAAGVVSRTFDLGLRDRDVRHADGTVSVTLASDEAVLTGHAPLADDVTPFTLAGSIRDVVDYVLGEAIPDAALAASPASDADATPYWELSNLIHNPRMQVSASGWHPTSPNTSLIQSNNGGAIGTGRLEATAIAAGSTGAHWTGGDEGAGPGGAGFTQAARAGQAYTGSMYVVGPAGKDVVIVLRFTNGVNIFDVVSDLRQLGPQDWSQRLVVTGTCPPGYSGVSMYVLGYAFTPGQTLFADAALLTEGTRLVDYFDGATPDDAHYRYEADGAPHASPSRRIPFPVARDPDALTWNAGQTALDFLHPLVQAAGLRLVCDEARTWTLRSESYVADGSLSIRHAVNLIDGDDRISRDAGIWFDAAVTTYTWTDRDNITHRTVDAYVQQSPYVQLQRFERDTPYPGPGFSQYAVRRAQGRGREVSATVVGDWSARAEQPVVIVLLDAPTQVGITQRIEWDLDTDEMTVVTRTTDTPEGAIDLLVGTIDALTGTIDQLGGSSG